LTKFDLLNTIAPVSRTVEALAWKTPSPEINAPLFQPLFPETFDQGDPYVLTLPKGVADFRNYIYTTGNENPGTGKTIRTYGTDDFSKVEFLGEGLTSNPDWSHWAPCVTFDSRLDNPFIMLISHGQGQGEEAHIGHNLLRAAGNHPVDFRFTGQNLTPQFDFAIDADVYRTKSGLLKVAFARDFVEDQPLGTGIVEATLSEDLTHLTGPIKTLARAVKPWQIYEEARIMPWKTIPGVNWETDTVCWNTVEAPIGGLVSPAGRSVNLYSSGCFYKDNYAVGALVENEDGSLADVTTSRDHFVLRSLPERGIFSVGHPSWLRTQSGKDYLLAHARFGSVDAPRQLFLAQLEWNDQDLPYCFK
jgi:hypothetical protein